MKKLAVVCDFSEENWPSMDLFAVKLLENLRVGHTTLEAAPIRPAMIRRFGRLPLTSGRRFFFNADRLLNRWIDYPRILKPRVAEFDLFHVCDHSYAHLIHRLPAGRTGVFCHDLDAFRCLLEPQKEPRSFLFKAMARRILSGLQKAAVVFHTTAAVRREIERHGLLDPARLVQAPCGVSPVFSPAAPETEPAEEVLSSMGGAPYLLHVGSCIPRKRIDLLLRIFAGLKARRPELRLIQFGGVWTSAQAGLIETLGLKDAVRQLSGRDESFAASLYRQAALVLLPSEAEGFGIPMIEALACGKLVLASDIPSLREVGGDAAVYRPVGEVATWVDAADQLLADPASAPSREARLAQPRRFSWPEHARIIFEAYRRLP